MRGFRQPIPGGSVPQGAAKPPIDCAAVKPLPMASVLLSIHRCSKVMFWQRRSSWIREAATGLLKASDEDAQLFYEIEYADWLYRPHELK